MINERIINNIFYEATSKGADFAEVFVEDKYNTMINMDNEKVEKGLVAKDYGIGIRVFFGNTYGYTYTSDDSEENLIAITKDLCRAFVAQRNITFHPIAGISEYRFDVKKQFSHTAYKQKIDIIKQAITSGRGFNEGIKRMSVAYLDQEQRVIIANTEGVYKEDCRIKTRMFINAFAEKNGVVQSAFVGPGAAAGFEFYDTLDIGAYSREAARSATVIAGAKYCKAGQMPVVIENGFGGLVFHEACGHSLEASSVARGNSEFSGKLGQKVASDELTLIDDGTIEKEWGSLSIDDEGTKTQKNILIEDGILKGYMVDKLNGRIMNMESTGSGRRESYKFPPTSRMTNTYIKPGKHKDKDIISDTQQGLYVKSISAGSVNPVTGEFNFSVQESYLIENGKITVPVRGATLIGRGTKVLKRVDRVGDNLQIGHGYCFAESGALFIGAGQPTVRISKMTVGGME